MRVLGTRYMDCGCAIDTLQNGTQSLGYLCLDCNIEQARQTGRQIGDLICSEVRFRRENIHKLMKGTGHDKRRVGENESAG